MDEFEGSWVVDFYDLEAGFTAPCDAALQDFGDVHERARVNGARDGTPIILSMRRGPDARLDLFFRSEEMETKQPATWRRYAYALVVWLNFLEQRGKPWSEAVPRDYADFKYWRMADGRNVARVRGTSFDTDRAALLEFYRWAGEEYAVANPISARPAPSSGPQGNEGRDPDRPAGAPHRDVKWLLRSAFEQWRDVGLRGYGFDGRRPQRWRGLNEDRDVAFVEGLWGTGLRLEEWASVLDVELPSPDAPGRYPKVWLSKACAKGRRYGRHYWIPRSVVGAMAAYADPVEGSRREAIERARHAGRYERLPSLVIVAGHNRHNRTIFVKTSGGTRALSLDLVSPKQRRSLFRETSEGLEPLAVWLSVSGMPRQAHSWERTYALANARIAESWVHATAPDLVGEVREAHKAGCPLWARPHMMRHSFALRWYSILSAVWEHRLAGLSEAEKRAWRDQFADVWFTLSKMLGHLSPLTTKDWYLAPFTSLEIDYLMAMMDEEEHRAVTTLLAKITGDSGLVLSAITPDDANGTGLAVAGGAS